MFSVSNCQEKFLSNLISNQSTVSVYLKNGIKLTGKIIGATHDAIFLNDPVPQIIYKKRISTILPQHHVTVAEPSEPAFAKV